MVIDTLKSINSNFTHQNFDMPILTFCLILAKKREKIWLDWDSNSLSVDQKSIVVPCQKNSKSIHVTYVVMRQKVSLGLSKFWWTVLMQHFRLFWGNFALLVWIGLCFDEFWKILNEFERIWLEDLFFEQHLWPQHAGMFWGLV